MAIINLDQNCSLRALAAISSLPDSNLYHFEYELRHPQGIYRNSIGDITELFDKSLDMLFTLHEEYSSSKTINNLASVINVYKGLLYKLREFIDDCYLILQSITPVDSKLYPKIIFSNQYLKRVKYPGFNKFENLISYYKCEYIGAIVNSIKHKQRNIRGICLYGKAHDNLFIPGYYVEGVSKSGMLAPCRSVHSDENSAFSFNRDLKRHLWYLLLIDGALCEAIESAKNYWKIPEKENIEIDKCHSIKEIVKRIQELPNQFFFDEQLKPTVRMEVTDKGIEVEYPYKKGIQPLPDHVSVKSMHKVDLSVPYMKLPYFKQNA